MLGFTDRLLVVLYLTTMSYYLPVLISVICYLYFFFTRSFNYWNKKNVKGPRPIPFFGNLIDLALRRKQAGIIYKEIYEQYPDEKIVGIYRMTSPSLIIRDLDIAKQILIKDFDVFSDRAVEFSREKLGDNLFHCGADTWRALRNKFTPAFTSGKLRSMFYLFDQRGDRFVDYIENACLKQREQNVCTLFQKYTIATIMAAIFDLNVDTFNDDNQMFDDLDKGLFTSSYTTEMDMLYPGVLTKYNISIFGETVIKFCHEVARTVIKQRNENPSIRGDVMDQLISLKQNGTVQTAKRQDNDEESTMEITDNVIAGQVFVLYTAGYGNNTLTLSYAMYHLAQNADIQDRLIAEIDKVLQENGGKLTYDTLHEMKYLDMVFSETLRINPLTNSLSRAANQDYKFIDTDLTINKGTTVIISPYAIQHDEKNYPNPEKFDPERFSPEMVRERHPCAYIPFGAGPRVCLGSRLAKIQFGVCVVKLLSKFRVEFSNKTPLTINYDPRRTLLKPVGGLHLNLIPRN